MYLVPPSLPVILPILQPRRPRYKHPSHNQVNPSPNTNRHDGTRFHKLPHNRRADQREDGAHGPHHARPGAYGVGELGGQDEGDSGCGEAEEGAAEDPEEDAEGEGVAFVAGEGPEGEDDHGGAEAADYVDDGGIGPPEIISAVAFLGR